MKKSRTASGRKRFKIVLNSPAILVFTLICVVALILGIVTKNSTTRLIFSVYRSSLTNPLTYVRFFGHVFGHANLSHLAGNIMMILVIGPMLEERYGSGAIVIVIAVTALVTGIIHFIFFPSTALLGASGVVFAMILLASVTGIRDREIPLTFILVTVLYIGQQIYEGIFVSDNVSQLTHIAGGIVGAVLGYQFNRKK
ncbi:MAG: rhomboid family intramembrane serine protease [Lachnospiraceae bacterium]|nr:rhomboid family intramembrane serine protease [Lachnospiraceae bacterium]